jgi:GNAT superfamily N-acetyltransferase
MHVRQLIAGDWQANRTIRLEALAECPGAFFTSLAEAEARTDAEWQAMLTDPGLGVFGLYDGGDFAGLTGIYLDPADPEGRTAGLAMSYIRPAWRGRGLSPLLYAARIGWARAHGIDRIIVSCRDSNEPSRRAIERHGFIRTRSEMADWPDGSRAENIHYELML